MLEFISRNFSNKDRAKGTRIPVSAEGKSSFTPFDVGSSRNVGGKIAPTKVEAFVDLTLDDEDDDDDFESAHGGHTRAFVNALMSFGQEEVAKYLNAILVGERKNLKRARASDAEYHSKSSVRKGKPKKTRRDTDENGDSDFDPTVIDQSQKKEPLTDEYMCRVLDYMEKNPNLPFESVREKFTSVQSESLITRFRRCRGKPGSKPGTYAELTLFCKKMCDEADKNGIRIDKLKIREWALQRAEELHLWRFVASDGWIAKFNREHRPGRENLSLGILEPSQAN